MPDKHPHISHTFLTQGTYRKYSETLLSTLDTHIPAIGDSLNATQTAPILAMVDTLLETVHTVVFTTPTVTQPLKKIIVSALFQATTDSPSVTDMDDLLAIISPPILNTAKVYYLTHHIDQLLVHFEPKILFLVATYKRHLPKHVASSEGDDLLTIAQLELIETFKAWQPHKNPDMWPLAYSRINGAMKDHIRYISKSDPTRFYDWVVDASQMYMTMADPPSFEQYVENSDTLERVIDQLSPKERQVLRMYVMEDLTLGTIAQTIGLSESQVSRIYKKAFTKIKRLLLP
jgi:RNA polymerase sigma factor (sigma-70 family)